MLGQLRCVLIDPLFRDLHLDISSACQWQLALTRVCRRFLNLAAAVWETLLTLVGYASGLVLLRPMDRQPQAPHLPKRFFRAF